MEQISISALLGTLFALLVLSGFFSIAETSMMALNRYKLKHLVSEGALGAALTQQLLTKTDKLLGVILLGNNLINAASATIATVIAVRLLGDNEFALSIATLLITFAILVFSEITPKVVGAAYPERIALPLSFILSPMLKVFYPVVWFVNLFVSALLFVLGLKPRQNEVSMLSMEELRTLILETSHFIPPKHQSILLNLFELENITVDDVMTPRTQIEAIDINDSPTEISRSLSTSNHTRVIIYQEQLDNVVGIVHVRKVLHQAQNAEMDAEALTKIMRPAYFIPAGTPLFTQLQHFQENQRRIGLVVDEYGELKGLVSLEDILEEIVGEFTTQSPIHGSAFRQQPDGSWLVDGTSSLRAINRKLGLSLPLGGPKTINGLVLEHFEDIPEPGTTLKVANHTLEIVQTQDRVVKVVRLFPPSATLPAAS